MLVTVSQHQCLTVHTSSYQYAKSDLQALVEQSLHTLRGSTKTLPVLENRLPSLRELFPPALLNCSIKTGVQIGFRATSDFDCRLPPIANQEDLERPRKRQKEDFSSKYHVLSRQAQSSCEEELRRLVKKAEPGETDGLPSRIWFKCTAVLDIPGSTSQTCGYIGEKQTVRRHIRTAHLKLKPWMCSCGREFSQRCSGITHANTFNGVKNLPCLAKNCDEMFSDAAMRNRHVKCAHEGEVIQETRRKSAYVRPVSRISLSMDSVTRTEIVVRAKL